MRNLPRILSKVYRDPWLIRPETLHSIADILQSRLTGKQALDIEIEPEEDDEEEEVEKFGSSVCIKVFGVLGKHLSGMEMDCGGCSVDMLCDALEDAEEDDSVKTIYLHFNSPGGTVTGIPEAGALIRRVASKKNVIALTDGDCCSAAYWMASQCNEIIATPSACLGSIGVYCLLLDESRALENMGVKVNAISAGEYKLAGASFRPLSETERKMFQDGVNKTYEQFKQAVKSARPGVKDETMQGQTFDGEEAFAVGLVDDFVTSLSDYIKTQVDSEDMTNV